MSFCALFFNFCSLTIHYLLVFLFSVFFAPLSLLFSTSNFPPPDFASLPQNALLATNIFSAQTEDKKSALDGHTTLKKDQKGETVIAVMVENHPSARPQLAGLNQAAIIYEAEAEGGITRFLGIFNDWQIEKVGPVRSARPYFIDFAAEYGAVYAHAGGSEPALQQLQNGTVLNVEALQHEGDGYYFFRDTRYSAPHNLFANLSALPKLIQENAWSEESQDRFQFSPPLSAPSSAETNNSDGQAHYISLNFSTPSYRVDYYYDSAQNRYSRYLAGAKHLDRSDNSQFQPANIIVQFTEYQPYDEYGRLTLRTAGEGKSLLFKNGEVWQGIWRKDKNKTTKFLKNDGQEFELEPGQTFVEVIKPERVTWNATAKTASTKEKIN